MNVSDLEHVIDDELHALVQKLAPKLQERVYKQFNLLMDMPLYPSLHLKKVKGQKSEQWSIYISRNIALSDTKMKVSSDGIGSDITVNMIKS